MPHDRSSFRSSLARTLVLSLALAGCGGGDSGAPKATRLRVDPGTITIDIGATAQFVATAVDAEGNAVVNTNPIIEWRSLAPGVATVDQAGMVTGVGAGNATIEALAGSLSGRSQVAVNRAPVGQVTIEPGTLSLARGASGTLTARTSTSAGVPVTDAVVTWTSLTPQVATVAASGSRGTTGTVTAVAPGSAVVRATSEGVTADVTVFIGPDPVITLSGSTVAVALARTSRDTVERVIQVSNSGGGTLGGLSATVQYPGGGAGGWLSATLSSTAQPATLVLRATAGPLPEGSYQALVRIASSLPAVVARDVAVTLVVGPGPSISVASATASFSSFAGAAPPGAQSITVSNAGGGTLSGLTLGTLDWGAVTWATVTLSGSVAPVSLSITPTAAAAQLAAGSYSVAIPIASTLPGVASRTVTATITVGAPPVIALSPASVTFSAAFNGAPPPAQVVTVGNAGGGVHASISLGAISYAGGTTGWLTATLQNPTSPTPTVQLTASAAGLPLGVYFAVLQVRSGNPFVVARDLDVTLNVGAAQVITIATPTVAVSTLQGGASPPARFVLVSNGGTGVLSGLSVDPVTYSGGATGWMTATLQGGSAPTNLALGFTTGALAVGSYTASVVVRSTIPGTFPTTLTVALTVNSGAVISIAPATLGFVALGGGTDPLPATVSVTNGGIGALSGLSLGTTTYGAGQPVGWLVSSLNATSAPAFVTLAPASAGLAPGSYSATVPVQSALAGVAPRTIAVTLQVLPATTIALSTSNVTLNAPNGGGNPAPATVSVTNAGSNPLTGMGISVAYTGSAPTNWLTATLSSSVAPATISLAANVATLPSGSYSATVTVASPVALNSPRTIGVTLVVPPPIVALSATATSVSINQSVGTVVVSFSPSAISLANGGGGTLTGITRAVTYNQGSGWLTSSLSSTTAPSVLNVSVNTAAAAALARGTYTATVAISAPGASTVFVTVTLRALLTYNTHVASLWLTAPGVAANQQCGSSSCHATVAPDAGLDLVTNAGANTVYARLLAQTGTGGVRLVLPNAPLSSLMYTRTASTTSPMPTGGRVALIYNTIFNWISDGARQ